MLQDENYNEDYLAEIDRMRKMTDPIIMFGAGLGKEYDLDYLRHLEIFPKAICDNNPQKWGKKVYDLQIQSFESIKKNFPNAYFYVTANHYFEDIVKQITEAGYPKDRISKFIIILYFKNEDVSVEYYQKHNKELEKLASLLGDEKSREVLRNRILFHKTRERKLMLNIRSENQYFDEGLFNVKGISTYVDIGAYTGDSIERFVNLSMGKYMQIYGFEPDINFCAKANERLKKYSNVNCVPLGLSDQTGDYYADATTGNMMTIDKATFNVDKKTEKIFHIVRLDDFFKEKDEKIDLISMDIEGAELSALRGAEMIIKKNKPILAICVYHKIDDILEIPRYCLSLGIKYRIFLRHYSCSSAETVCYFVPY